MTLTTSDWPADFTFGFRRDGLDRAAHLRRDAAALDAHLADPRCRMVIVGAGDAMLLRASGGARSALHAMKDGRALCGESPPIFLGLRQGIALFAGQLAADTAMPGDGFDACDLRAIVTQGLVPADELSGIAAAKSLVQWHARHGFCANCGAQTQMSEAGWRRDCSQCGAQHFPRTDPVAIMAVGNDERCLLGRQARFPEGMWSCLAGFVEPGEALEDAVRREVFEESGIVCDDVRILATQPWPYPSSLMIGAFARPKSFDIRIDPLELEAARWFDRAELRRIFDGTHPDGLRAPPAFAIAHHLLRHWLMPDGAAP